MFTHRVKCLGFFFFIVSGPLRAGEDKSAKLLDDLPPGARARLGSARFLNFGRVFALAYSPDGRLLATGAWDGSIRLWETATGKERLRLDGHKGPVQKLAFSPDGKWLASAGKEPGICLWEVTTGRLSKSMQPDEKSYTDVAVSPNGQKLAGIASGVRSGTLYVWDMTGKELWNQGGDRVYTHCAFRGPNTLASTYYVQIKNPPPYFRSYLSSRSFAPEKELDLQELRRGSATFGPDGKFVAFHSEGEVWYLHAERCKLAPVIHLSGQTISDLCISPDCRMLAFSGDSWGEGNREAKLIRVWEISTGQERCRFASPDKGRLCLAFSPDGRTLASGSIDVTALLWDLTGEGQKETRRTPLPVGDLEKLWEDLRSSDGATAYRSFWKLVLAPEQAAVFLAKTLRPAPPSDPKRVAALVRDLADTRFAIRQQANTELLKLEELAEPALLEVLLANPGLEVRRRIDNLLQQIDQLSPEKLRHVRAVEALERMHTPQADELLRVLASGAPAARLTREAAEALLRQESAR